MSFQFNPYNLYAPWGSFWNMRYGPSQLGCSFPCLVGRTTHFKTMSPSRISIGLTVRLYHLMALCLTANSRKLATSLNSSTKFVAHSDRALFTSCLNWVHHHEGASISMGNMASDPYTMQNGVSLVVNWRWCNMETIFHGAVSPINLWHHRASFLAPS